MRLSGEYRHQFFVRRAAGIISAVWLVSGQLTQPNVAGWQIEAERSGHVRMHGNVPEWCQDRWQRNAKRASSESETIKSDLDRVLRGGAFNDNPDFVRFSHRSDAAPSAHGFNIGFRPARTLP